MEQNSVGNTKPLSKSRRYCFTINNPIEDDDYDLEHISYKHIIYAVEIGEENTRHYQGYIEFENPISFQSVKKKLPRAHIEKAKGNRKQNIDYCTKGGDVVENTFPLDIKTRVLKLYEGVIWKSWQRKILDIISEVAHPREIHWVYDETGNTGKTFLSKYIACKFDGVIIGNGKMNDVFNCVRTWMIEHIDESPKIILVDIPRCSIDYVNYGLLEKLKDGIFYSGKYEGGLCIYDNPHVIVFGNELPNFGKMSGDRWKIVEVTVEH